LAQDLQRNPDFATTRSLVSLFDKAIGMINMIPEGLKITLSDADKISRENIQKIIDSMPGDEVE
jgi:hypothetical protein